MKAGGAIVHLLRAPAIVWALVIMVLIVMPNPMIPRIGFWTFILNSDKFWHALLFFVQTATAWLALFAARASASHSRSSLAKAALWSFTYGVVTELIQLALPDRFSSIGDIAANTAGILVFILLYMMHIVAPLERKVLSLLRRERAGDTIGTAGDSAVDA